MVYVGNYAVFSGMGFLNIHQDIVQSAEFQATHFPKWVFWDGIFIAISQINAL